MVLLRFLLETCLSVNNNSCRKLVLSLESPIMLEDNLNITLVSCFIADFNSLTCEFDSFTFENYCIQSFYTTKILKMYKTFTVPCENSKIVFVCFFKNKVKPCISCSI